MFFRFDVFYCEKMEVEAILMFEMVGRPKDYIVETLKLVLEKLGDEIKIKSKKIAEPKLMDNQKLFSTFAEVGAEMELEKLFSVILRYMPSHVEMITPEQITMSNYKINELANDIVKRIHQYDEISKKIGFENRILNRKLNEERKKSENRVTEKKEENEKLSGS